MIPFPFQHAGPHETGTSLVQRALRDHNAAISRGGSVLAAVFAVFGRQARETAVAYWLSTRNRDVSA